MIEDKGFLSRWSDRKLKNETDVPSAAEADSNEETLGEDEFEANTENSRLMHNEDSWRTLSLKEKGLLGTPNRTGM